MRALAAVAALAFIFLSPRFYEGQVIVPTLKVSKAKSLVFVGHNIRETGQIFIIENVGIPATNSKKDANGLVNNWHSNSEFFGSIPRRNYGSPWYSNIRFFDHFWNSGLFVYGSKVSVNRQQESWSSTVIYKLKIPFSGDFNGVGSAPTQGSWDNSGNFVEFAFYLQENIRGFQINQCALS